MATPSQAARYEEAEVLGEVVVAGRPKDEAREEEVDALAAHSVAQALLAQGQSASAVAKELRRRMASRATTPTASRTKPRTA